MSNLKTLIIELDYIGYEKILKTPTLKELFHENQLKTLKEGINFIRVNNFIASKMLNILNTNNPLIKNQHITCYDLNSILKNQSQIAIHSGKLYYEILEGQIDLNNSNIISYFNFKNRKKDKELLPKENKKIIFLYKDNDKINLLFGDWIPYNGITQDYLFCDLNDFGLPKYPAIGYLGSVQCLSNNVKISFNVWEQNNSEFIIWREYNETIFKLLELLFQHSNEESKIKTYNELTKI